MKFDLKLVEYDNLKALVTVIVEIPEIGGEIEIKGFKVMVGQDGGYWVGMPSKEVVKDGEKKYVNQVYIADKDVYENFRRAILDAFYAEAGIKQDGKAAPQESRPVVKRQPARKPVPPAPSNTAPIREPGEDREDLPPHDENPFPGEDCPF